MLWAHTIYAGIQLGIQRLFDMKAHQSPRWRKIVIAVLFVVAGSTLPIHAADWSASGYTQAPVPTWVIPTQAGTMSPNADAVGGQHHLLVDRQYRDDGKSVAFYFHHVTEVVGQAGLSDNSNLSISYDPSYERLQMHKATVFRDGVETDRLEQARVDVARTEDSSHLDLLNGAVTALVVLPDVRIGDRVAVSYTVHGRNPVFGPKHHSTWRAQWGVSVARSFLRVTVPALMTLSKSPRPEAAHSEKVNGKLRTLEWQWENIEASEAEDYTTDWFPDPDLLELTGYGNWQEVAQWGAALFTGHSAEGEHYQRLTQSIQAVAKSDGLSAGIAAAIDHVQKHIRYYGIELGANSHQPHAPDEVLVNGYGDCKDKALLLVTLLDDLDVKAWPILVSSRMQRGILERLPSPGVFDHVVVLVEHGGEQFWVDATDNSQSGTLGFRGQPEYGAGLVLGKPGEALIIRKAPLPKLPSLATNDQLFISAMGGPVDFITSTEYRGSEANRIRSSLDETGKRGLQKKYLEFYEGLHGKIRTLSPLVVEEDTLRNVIKVTESYRFDEFWTVDERAGEAEFDIYALAIRNQLDELPDGGRARNAPLKLNGPMKVAHRIQIHPNVSSAELEERTFGIDGFNYRDSEYLLGDALVFESELEISTDELLADQLGEYEKFRNRVLRNAQAGRYFTGVEKNEIKEGGLVSSLLEAMEDLRP